MFEDAAMNRVDDGVGVEAPILAGPHFVLIGGCSFEARAAVQQWREDKVRAFRLKIAVFQMTNVNLTIWRRFGHEKRFVGNAKRKVFVGLPCENLFLEAARRKTAFTIGCEAFSLNTRFD